MYSVRSPLHPNSCLAVSMSFSLAGTAVEADCSLIERAQPPRGGGWVRARSPAACPPSVRGADCAPRQDGGAAAGRAEPSALRPAGRTAPGAGAAAAQLNSGPFPTPARDHQEAVGPVARVQAQV